MESETIQNELDGIKIDQKVNKIEFILTNAVEFEKKTIKLLILALKDRVIFKHS